MAKKVNTRIIHKHETEADWNLATNFIPLQGELIIYDIDSNYEYERFKLGDGVTKVKDLPFLNLTPNITKNLLSIENLSKWSIERQLTDEGDYIGHYAGAVDLSDKDLSGVSGALVQLATDSFYSAWTDFKYRDKVSLGNDFQFKITPFIKTNDYNSGAQIFEDSFVDVKLGNFSIRLFRWVNDMYDMETGEYKKDNFYKLRVGICLDDQLAAYSAVVTTPNSDYITTNICDGKPASTELGKAKSQLINYMRSYCLDQHGSMYGEHSTTTFTANDGFQDLTVAYDNETIQILNVNNEPLQFYTFLPNEQGTIVEVPLTVAGCQDANGIIGFQKVVELSEKLGLSLPIPTFNDIDIKVRCYHDRAAALYHPFALMRFEITKNNSPLMVDQSYNPKSRNAQSGMAMAGVITDLTDRIEILEAINLNSWDSVQKIVQSGLAPQMFPIGYQFSVHHDEYGDMLYDVVAHDYLKSAEDENAHTMTLLSHNIVLNAQYDNGEAYGGGGLNYVFKTIPTTIPAGTVCGYYAYDNTDYGWYFTVDVEIPAGSYATYYPGESSSDRVYVLIYSDETATNLIYSSEGKQSYFNLEQPTFEGFTFTEIDAGLSTFKFINDEMRDYEGSNNYKESAIRQFLNSAETAGNWWQPQTNVDLPPEYTNKNGFLYGLDSEFLNVVGTVNLPCAANDDYEHPDSEVTKGSAYILQDKFYLPSATEITGAERDVTIVADGSNILPYYENHSNDVTFSIKYTKEGVSNNYWTRTPGAEYSFLTVYIESTGGTNMNTAANSYGIVPMCTIM